MVECCNKSLESHKNDKYKHEYIFIKIFIK